MYNGTTCLRSSVQTNSGPALSVSCSLFLSPFFSHFPPSLFLSLSFRPFYPRPLSSHTLFPPILHDTILSLPPLSTPRASSSRACSCSRLPILLRHSSSPFSLSTSVARTTVNKPLIGLTPISGALFVVNERPAVTSITRVLQCFFLPPSATTPSGPSSLAICHCCILKCGLMTIYHLCISRRSLATAAEAPRVWVYS